MKHIIFLLLIMFTSALTIKAQQYKINYVQSIKRGGIGRQQINIQGVDPDQLNKELSRVRKTYYELHINGNESFYKESDRVDGNEQGGGMMFMMNGNAEIYINHNTAAKIEKIELNEKDYIITDTLKQMPWQLINEERTLLGVLCKKATIKIKATQRRPAFIVNGQNTQINTDTIKRNDSTEVIAWYAPSINVNAAPNSSQLQLAGSLPGCVLAVFFGSDDSENNIIATEITNTIKAKWVKAPEKGKRITREEYNKKREELINQMRENMRNGGGRTFGMGMQ
jgi:GLPGLI family protein